MKVCRMLWSIMSPSMLQTQRHAKIIHRKRLLAAFLSDPYLIWIQQHWQRSAAINRERKKINPHLERQQRSKYQHELMLTHRPESWECCPPPTLNLHPRQAGGKNGCKKGNAAIYCTQSHYSRITSFQNENKGRTWGAAEILTGFVSAGFTVPLVSPLVALSFMPSAAKKSFRAWTKARILAQTIRQERVLLPPYRGLQRRWIPRSPHHQSHRWEEWRHTCREGRSWIKGQR